MMPSTNSMAFRSVPLLLPLLVFLVASPLTARSRSIPELRRDGRHRGGGDANGDFEDSCAGRRIHVRKLPSQFNTDLLATCDAYPLLSDESLCPYLVNHGLGPRTHNRSRSWYRTDPIFLEVFFHRRVLEYPCLAADPSDADAVFLPYYAALDALPYLFSPPLFNSSALHGLPLADFLRRDSPAVWSRRAGHDHFLVMARPAWDFSQDQVLAEASWGTSFLRLTEFLNVTALTLESRPWPWQEHAIPSPTSFHPATPARLDAWITRARRSQRSTLMLFAGGGGSGGPNIRGSIKAECENLTNLCEVVECSDGACTHDPIRFMRPMLRSKFCLQPPGDTPTRRSTFDGILAGCIPVFFEEAAAAAQFAGWHLPPKSRFEEFSVYIPKEDVVFGGKRITDVLSAIPPDDVRRMRYRVLELAPAVMYRRHGSAPGLRAQKDAFDLAIEGALRRIKRRVTAFKEGRDLLSSEDEDADEGNDDEGDGDRR